MLFKYFEILAMILFFLAGCGVKTTPKSNLEDPRPDLFSSPSHDGKKQKNQAKESTNNESSSNTNK